MPNNFVSKPKSNPLEYSNKKVSILDTPDETSAIRCEECKNAKAVTLEQPNWPMYNSIGLVGIM